ncbi:MAG: acyl-CoA dehydrogenase [Pseudomonadales bacterium]|nr:acyl-CoA dehydrogenase [Pseudomonadales bacterium]
MSHAYVPPEQDIQFVLNKVLGWDELFHLPAYSHADLDLGEAIIAEGSRFSTEVLSPLNPLGDAQGCRFVDGRVEVPEAFRDAFRQYASGGWIGLDLPEQYGGQALPISLATAISEIVNGACVAFGMMPCMLRAAATLLIEHADAELKEKVIPPIIAGEWGATIAITEPQAGSDVGAIKTCAVKQDDGLYQLTGAKIFITCGDQNYTEQILHFVLARTKGAVAGTRGLTLFLVPKRCFDQPKKINQVSVSRLEHKMGLKASPTCVLNFDQAVGYRIGVEGEGLRCLFTMMNLMRLEVAAQSVGIASAATQSAIAYANERKQGGRADTGIIQHADVRRMLATMRAYTEAMRALVLEASFNLDKSWYGASEVERQDSRLFAEFLLPVCKAWASDHAYQVANLGIQVMGGHGYITDEGMEQRVRDCRVLSIYEGTNGIQALDLVMRKLLRKGGRGYTLFIQRIEQDIKKHANSPELKGLTENLAKGIVRLTAATDFLVKASQDSLDDVEAAATPYLFMVGHIAGAWMWLRMAAAVGSGSVLYQSKWASAQFYMEYLLPETQVFESRIYCGARLTTG